MTMYSQMNVVMWLL